MSERVELTILRNLFFNEDFTRKVTPFIKPDYFTSRDERILFEEVEKFIVKYKNSPTKEQYLLKRKRKDINEDECKSVENLVNGFRNEEVDLQCC